MADTSRAQKKGTDALDAFLEHLVTSGFTAGVSAYVEQRGKTLYRGQYGMAVMEENRPVQEDTIFQIYSMSKAITSVAALILFERGLYRMQDPLSAFIPEFAKPKVYVEEEGRTYTRPAKREIFIRDLFTMTSGIPYQREGNTPTERHLGRVWRKAARDGRDPTTLEVAKMIASVPLEFDPGDHWKYGLSIDVLGALVEVLSGKTLSAFVKEEILEPLNMRDTGFFVPEDKWDRLASLYPAGKDEKILHSQVDKARYAKPPKFESGGGGMVSTLDDYAAFARMLLSGKTPDGVKLLGRKTLDLMSRNHLTPEQNATHDWDTQQGYGYGLAVRTLMDPSKLGVNGSVGEFGWDGYAGTWFCVDPSEDLFAVFMNQRAPGGQFQYVPTFMSLFYALL